MLGALRAGISSNACIIRRVFNKYVKKTLGCQCFIVINIHFMAMNIHSTHWRVLNYSLVFFAVEFVVVMKVISFVCFCFMLKNRYMFVFVFQCPTRWKYDAPLLYVYPVYFGISRACLVLVAKLSVFQIISSSTTSVVVLRPFWCFGNQNNYLFCWRLQFWAWKMGLLCSFSAYGCIWIIELLCQV